MYPGRANYPIATKPVFQHDSLSAAGDAYGPLTTSPWGNNDYRSEMAIRFCNQRGENLATGAEPDFWQVSFSSPDCIGY